MQFTVYGKKAKPLTKVTKKDDFKCSEQEEKAFLALKTKVTFRRETMFLRHSRSNRSCIAARKQACCILQQGTFRANSNHICLWERDHTFRPYSPTLETTTAGHNPKPIEFAGQVNGLSIWNLIWIWKGEQDQGGWCINKNRRRVWMQQSIKVKT